MPCDRGKCSRDKELEGVRAQVSVLEGLKMNETELYYTRKDVMYITSAPVITLLVIELVIYFPVVP